MGREMTKRGFTLVEVMLFLALSGALLALVIGGTQRNIAEKRYNDTVDNFVNYLENLYSSVSYVSHGGNGTSKQAVYGRLINMKTVADKTTFTSYIILGEAELPGAVADDALEAILKLKPTIAVETDGGGPAFVHTEKYIPSWGGIITSDHDDGTGHIEWLGNTSQILLLLLRHPYTGMTSTYVYYPSSAQDISETTTITGSGDSLAGKVENVSNGNFKKQDANFCIDSADRWAAGNKRRLIRIHSGANNASGVEAIANDEKASFCQDAP